MPGPATLVKGTGPALLLVHGAGGSIQANYGPVLGLLARHFTVIGPDLPGSGRSPAAAGPLDLDLLADALVDAAVAAGHDSFHVSGYSMGCAIAVTAAVRHPERVRGLVLSAPFAKADDVAKAGIGRWRALLDGPRDEVAAFVLSMMCSEAYLTRLSPSEVESFTRLIGITMPVGTAAHLDLVSRIDLSAVLPQVGCPTLVIGATGDRLISPALAREVADLIPGSKCTDLDCGHAFALEAALPWAGLITDFLTSAPS